MKILALGRDNYDVIIKTASEVISAGGMVVYPSDTVYGLGVDAGNENAVKKIFDFKGRKFGKAVSIAVDSIEKAEQYVTLNKTARNFYNNFFPGPYTVISKLNLSADGHKISPLLLAENRTLGVRIPNNKLIMDLVKKLGRPITATSANLAGKSPHYDIESFLNTLSEKKKNIINLIIDAGKLPRKPPSTVIDTTLESINVIRGNHTTRKPSNEETKISQSEKQTREIANRLFKQYYNPKKCLLFALEGELGAGKTIFAQGVAEAMNVGPVNSPTYTIIKEYGKLIHIDTYRLNNGQELTDLDFIKYIKPGNVIVIEWAGKIENWLRKLNDIKIVWVKINEVNLSNREIKCQMTNTK